MAIHMNRNVNDGYAINKQKDTLPLAGLINEKLEYKDYYPALLVELKWNHNVQSALDQIKEKVYPQSIQEYTNNLLLVGITYDPKTKEHRCKIEKF